MQSCSELSWADESTPGSHRAKRLTRESGFSRLIATAKAATLAMRGEVGAGASCPHQWIAVMEINRREFLKHTSAAALLASTTGFTFLAPPPSSSHATRLVTLGATGVRGSFLLFGTGVQAWNRQSSLGRLGERAAADLLQHALERGVNFFDLADAYGTHPLLARAMKDVPRERYTVLTKMLTGRGQPATERARGTFEEVDRFRAEIGTDVLDVCLLHLMQNDRWAEEKKRAMDQLSELKQRGVVRALGVSCHDFGAMKVAAAHPWVDVLLARVNHRGGSDFHMDGTADEVAAVLRTARANGKSVIGMKVYGQGKLSGAAEMDRSLRYVVGGGLVDAVTIGMLSRAELDDNLGRIDSVLRG
jgi:1-deoxyxylulose-5-phosphate synthase